jgi:hypothetical protein
MRLTAVLPLFALALPLGACQTLGLTSPAPDPALVDTGPVCPASAVLSDAVVVTKLKPGTPPGQPNPANVVFTAEMSQAKLDCDFNREKNTLSVDINFAVKAARGPAGMGADPQLDFFVAVVDADNNIISKTVYHGQPDLRGKQSNVYTQKVNNFPVPLAMDKRPYDYEILTGFQLTPDELAYNRVPRSLPNPRAATR